MALRDWVKTLDNRRSLKNMKSSYVISWKRKDYDTYLAIRIGHTYPLDMYSVELETTYGGVKALKKFKTKQKAILYAKNYMRRN